MRTKKIYVESGKVTSIDIIFVHPDYLATAAGARDARVDGVRGSHVLIQVNNDKIHIVDPRLRLLNSEANQLTKQAEGL